MRLLPNRKRAVAAAAIQQEPHDTHQLTLTARIRGGLNAVDDTG